LRITDHPILGKSKNGELVDITVDGKKIKAYAGEMVAAALVASGIKVFRYTEKYNQPRGIFCAIGRCTDCVMEVNGKPNVRTCITSVSKDMVINTQKGLGVGEGYKNEN